MQWGERCGYDRLGKLLLGKFHKGNYHWEVAAWGNAFGKKYLTSSLPMPIDINKTVCIKNVYNKWYKLTKIPFLPWSPLQRFSPTLLPKQDTFILSYSETHTTLEYILSNQHMWHMQRLRLLINHLRFQATFAF